MFFFPFILFCFHTYAWEGMSLPPLKVEGRYLTDTHGNIVNLHGFAQTYSPWFNERGTKWDNYDVQACLNYNQGLIDDILDAGWMMSFVRLHMDPYWSNTPGCRPDAHELPNCFNETRFRKYLDEVFVPMAEYAISKGLYVIMRPPGVCPEVIGINDDYNYSEYLLNVWDIVSSHPRIKNRHEIMFELANEPVRIKLADGTVGANSQAHFDVLKEIFQPVVNRIRDNGFNSVLWIPGSGYQSQYWGFAINPIEGENIGYAVHIYPGWFGSADGYQVFKEKWDEQIKAVADIAPIVITEMDWADESYNSSWGKGYTGVAGSHGFGANFKKIMDETGNASWLLFTDAHLLAQFSDQPPAPGEPYTFLNDPEACPWPIYHWYKDYANVEYPRPEFEKQSFSDNGNGTYTNPIIYADFPDPDVIRVENVYYMVSTTRHIFPGATLLKSYDLVNWQYCNNPLEIIDSNDAYNLLNDQDSYFKGHISSSLAYHKGEYYILVTSEEDGSFLLSSKNPETSWSVKKLNDIYQNPGLLFDEDEKIYIVHGTNELKITEINKDFDRTDNEQIVVESSDKIFEGNKLYKIEDYYYIYVGDKGEESTQLIYRSDNIMGPYEEKLLFNDDNIYNGALVQTQTGEWWTVLTYNKGVFAYLPNLQPVHWQDKWPVIGGNGMGLTTFRKPEVGRSYNVEVLPTNDNFRHYKLELQWGWNHNTDSSKWSLFERPGFLRLKTSRLTDDFLKANNTLTQRIFAYHSNDIPTYGAIKIDISKMKDGDVSGLAILQNEYAYIGIKLIDGEKYVVMHNEGNLQIGEIIAAETVFLRTKVDHNSKKASFYYSLDNIVYSKFGSDFIMKDLKGSFAGNKFGIFNYATKESGGYVDVDWFSTEENFSEEKFYDDRFSGYTEDEITLDRIYLDSDNYDLLIGSARAINVYAVFMDGHEEIVTLSTDFEISKPDIFKIVNGNIITLKQGSAVITATYSGKLGGTRSIDFNVKSGYFPLAEDVFNPSIWEKGSFNEITGELITGQYGFGGWKYDNGIDLSAFKYLVVQLKQPASGGASFRIFDENNYWSQPAMYDFGSQTQIVVNLQAMEKKIDGQIVKANPANIYIVGIWSHGFTPILIDNVYLSNSDDLTPTSIKEIQIKLSDNDIVDVYNLQGVKIRTGIRKGEALEILPAGVYILSNKNAGNEKVIVGNRSY